MQYAAFWGSSESPLLRSSPVNGFFAGLGPQLAAASLIVQKSFHGPETARMRKEL